MSRVYFKKSFVLVVSFLISGLCIAGDLMHNPFKQPDVEALDLNVIDDRDSKETGKPEFKLKGVIISRKPMANIDGEVLAVGDELDGYQLVEIKNEAAVFLRKGQRFVVNLEHGNAGKPNE